MLPLCYSEAEAMLDSGQLCSNEVETEEDMHALRMALEVADCKEVARYDAIKIDVVTEACGSFDDSQNIVGKECIGKSWGDLTLDGEEADGRICEKIKPVKFRVLENSEFNEAVHDARQALKGSATWVHYDAGDVG